jgi:hypothetical protein
MNLRQGPYLRVQRKFPDDPEELAEQIDQAYIDIAGKVNNRIIGIFTDQTDIVTGESWYLNGEPNRQQSLRRVYPFSDTNLVFPHGIDLNSITNFTRIWGTFFDSTSGTWNTLPYVDVVNATNQINVVIGTTTVTITKGAGSTAVIVDGLLTLEWLSQK